MENTSNQSNNQNGQNNGQNTSNNQHNNPQKNNQSGNQNRPVSQQGSKHTPEPSGDGRSWLKVVGAIVALLIIIALVRGSNVKKNAVAPETEEVATEQTVEGCNPGDKFSELDGTPCPVESEVSEASTPDDSEYAQNKASYDAVIKQYAGKMVLLSDMCNANPGTVTITTPGRVLIANNSVNTVAVNLHEKSVTLTPYHYATAVVDTAGSYPLTCNGATVATVVLQ